MHVGLHKHTNWNKIIMKTAKSDSLAKHVCVYRGRFKMQTVCDDNLENNNDMFYLWVWVLRELWKHQLRWRIYKTFNCTVKYGIVAEKWRGSSGVVR